MEIIWSAEENKNGEGKKGKYLGQGKNCCEREEEGWKDIESTVRGPRGHKNIVSED